MTTNITALNFWLSQLDDNAIENIAEKIDEELWSAESLLITQEKRDDVVMQIKNELIRIKEL